MKGDYSYSSWHPLLVRTLNKLLEDKRNIYSIRTGSVLAILARLPVPADSTPEVHDALPILRDLILGCSIEEAIKTISDLTSHFVEEQPSISESASLYRRCSVKKPSRRKRHRSNVESVGARSDSERECRKGTTSVHIHESVLLSDSDGFAACFGEGATGDVELVPKQMDDHSIYVMYKSIFGVYPTVVNALDCLVNGIVVHAKFAALCNVPAGVRLLCDFFSKAEEYLSDEKLNSLPAFQAAQHWLNWQAILKRSSRLVADLSQTLSQVVGCDFESLLMSGIDLLLINLKKNIRIAHRFSSSIYDSGDDTCLAIVTNGLQATVFVSLRIFDDMLSLINICSEKSYLSALCTCIVTWADDPSFLTYLPRILHSVEVGLDLYKSSPVDAHLVFSFEVFSSLIGMSSLTLSMLDWCEVLPCGFGKSVSGADLVAVFVPYLTAYSEQCVKALRRHLPVMNWVVTKDPNIPSMEVSRPVIELAKRLKDEATVDLLVGVCAVVMRYANPSDSDYLLVNTIIPSLEQACKRNELLTSSNETSMIYEMTAEMKDILKGLELLAAYLRSSEGAVLVIRSIVVPYRDFYFAAFELQDVFAAVCAKVIRLAPSDALESGLCEWLIARLEACEKHASIDIWIVLEDSAAKYSKLLLSVLNIFCDIMEENKASFTKFSERLAKSTKKLIDLCYEWLRAPTDCYRSIVRVSEILTKSVSIHLNLAKDSTLFMLQLRDSLLKSLRISMSIPLLSCVMTSLLDRCVSRLLAPLGYRSTVTVEDCSEDDTLMGDGGVLTASPRIVVHPKLATLVLEIVLEILRGMGQSSDDIEYMIGKICLRLQTLHKHLQRSSKWLPFLFDMHDELIRIDVSSDALEPLLNLVIFLCSPRPNSNHLQRLISMYHKKDKYKQLLITGFNRLLCGSEHHPMEALIFPQPSATPPVEITSEEHFEAQVADDRERTSSNSLLTAVENLLTRNLSDGEPEYERRREKKKYLREQVRGSSLADDLPVGENRVPSPESTMPHDRAASFTLTDTHRITATDGLSLSFWIRRAIPLRVGAVPEHLHLATLSNEQLQCSCWLTRTGTLFVNVIVGNVKLASFRLRGVIKECNWVHIVFCARLTTEAVTVLASVGDSFTNKEIPLLLKIQDASAPLTVSFGCLKRGVNHLFLLSSIFGFKGLLPPAGVLTLTSLGCELTSLAESHIQHLIPNLRSITTKKIVASRQHTLEIVRQDPFKYIQKIQRIVVFVIRPSSAHSYGVSILPPDVEPNGIVGTSALILARLQTYPITWYSRLVQQVHVPVGEVLNTIGGIKVVLHLFVKAINDHLPVEVQLEALKLLLNCLRKGGAICHQLSRTQVHSVIVRSLASPLAILDDKVLGVLLDYCVEWSPEECEDELHLKDDTQTALAHDPFLCVVMEPELLVDFCCRSEIWRGTRFFHWRYLISAVASTIEASSCKGTQAFNTSQLLSSDMLRKLLHCLLEMIQDPINFPEFSFDEIFVNDVLSIVRCLLGTPELPPAVAHLWFFIFLSHPASFTYIDHRVQGFCSWLHLDYIRDDGEGELLGDSILCQALKEYVQVIGRETLCALWKNRSSIEIRRTYEEMGGKSDFMSRTSHPEPDLIRGLSARSESSGTSDSPLFVSQLVEKPQKTEPHWVISLRASLMNLMASVFQNGADSLLSVLQHDVISWNAIIVLMSHQKDQRVRDAAVDMLQKFLLRSPAYTKVTFLRLSGFHMLATQLRGFATSPAIADFLFSFVCGETIRLGDGLDQTHLVSMPVDQMSCDSLYAILVAYEEAVVDAPLFWNMSNALLKIFENNSQLQQALVDTHLADAMVATLRRIAYLDAPTEKPEIVMQDRPPTSLQLECWSNFAQRIITASIPYNDRHLYRVSERFIWLLCLADIQASRDDRYCAEARHRAQQVIRSQLCQLLLCWMESVQTVFSEEGRSASATTSVDSLYRSGDGSSSNSSPVEDYDYCDDIITPERAHLLDGTSPVAALFSGSFANLREKISTMGPISRKTLRCTYKKRVGPAPLAYMEALTERMIFALDTCANIFSIMTPTVTVSEEEQSLFRFNLNFMISCWKREREPARSTVQTVWFRLISLCRERVRILLAQLVAFVLFPAHKKMYETALVSRNDIERLANWRNPWIEEKRHLIVKALASELQIKNNLTSLLSVNLDYEYALCLGLLELAFVSEPNIASEFEISQLIRFINNGKVGSPIDKFTPEALNNLTTDEILSMHSYSQHRKGIVAQYRRKVEAYKDEEEKLTALVSEMAMAVTCEVVEEQGLPRKVFIKDSKALIGEFVEAEQLMNRISKEICHPQAAGFETRHWPVGWALDPTEGPMRERRRLIPYYYPFDARFFANERKEEVRANQQALPYQNLLSTPLTTRSVLENAKISEPIKLFLDATVLRGTFSCDGELLVGESNLHFVGEQAKTSQKGAQCSVITLSWRFDQLSGIHMRNHLLKDLALEMFTTSGDTYLIVFPSNQKRYLFKCHLVELGLEHLFANPDQLVSNVMQGWRHGSISNFEYLMHLNKLAGRSFNDLMQYPVFPFVLSDYTSAILDLSNPASYRNLAKPMAIQDKRMEAHYVANYNCLQLECSRMSAEEGPLHFGPYHYGSHYSNSGIVVHYLVRLSPFTQIALEYQDNNFDIPDRLFNSIEATWRLSSCDSTTDFKELTPEFFYLPEFLTNRDCLDLGERQGGERVGAVRLPAWIPNQNPRLFVLVHRQALESLTVSQNLHSWIDLIFGFKQTGKAALEALNVFHPATYLGRLNADELEDELSQSALRTMVRSYGQMPIQILSTPHQPNLTAIREKNKPITNNGNSAVIPSPIPSVVGVRWGDFVGSPEYDASHIQVTLSVKGSKSDRLAQIVPLPDGTVAGVPRNTLLVARSQPENPKDLLCKTKVVTSLIALSWHFPDSVLRFRAIKPELQSWINLLDLSGIEISAIEYSSNTQLLFVAISTGLVKIYRFEFDSEGFQSITHMTDLYGHHSAVGCIAVSDEYSIVVTGDSEGKVFIWDINRVRFVRSISRKSHAVTALCVSSISGDIAVVSQEGCGSYVELFSINGELIGTVHTESTVICISMTGLPEGCAINCIALGMQDGHIRLVEMWCLSVVRDIWHEEYLEPVVSVEFIAQGRKLFAVLASGRILCWQSIMNLSRNKAPQFMIINPYELSA